MHLRDLRPDDLERMYALDVLCFAPAFRFTRAAMKRFACMPHALVRLAVEPGQASGAGATTERLLGFGIVHGQPSTGGLTGYVMTLDVHPAWRGQGLATRLMQRMEDASKTRGAVTMSLHVYAGNAPAIRFYERLGYRRYGREPDLYGAGLDALCYKKILDDPPLPETV